MCIKLVLLVIVLKFVLLLLDKIRFDLKFRIHKSSYHSQTRAPLLSATSKNRKREDEGGKGSMLHM